MTGMQIRTRSRYLGGGLAVALLTGTGYLSSASATPPNPVFYEPVVFQSAKVNGNWVTDSHPVGIAVVDVTTASGGGSVDGWKDILIANGNPGIPDGHKSVTIYRNATNWDAPSSSVFVWHATYELSGYGVPWDIGAADMDGGGKPDLVVAMIGDTGIHDQYILVLNNLGNGSWDYQNPIIVTFPSANDPWNLGLADLNYTPESRKDIAIATAKRRTQVAIDPAIGIGLQQSNGTISVQPLLVPDTTVGGVGMAIVAAKLKSGGSTARRDLLLGMDGTTGFIGKALNETSGWSLSKFGTRTAAPTSVVAGRFRNSVSYNDAVIVPPSGNQAYYLTNDGSGNFSESAAAIQWNIGTVSYGADAGDVNSDGWADFAVACQYGHFPDSPSADGGVELLLSKGDKSFESQSVTAWKNPPTNELKPCFVRIADLNQDTCLDLVVSLTEADRISIIVTEKVMADNNQLYVACGEAQGLIGGGGDDEDK